MMKVRLDKLGGRTWAGNCSIEMDVETAEILMVESYREICIIAC